MAAATTSSPSFAPTSSAFRPILLYDKNAPPTVIASVATASPPADRMSGPADYIELHSGSIWGGHHIVAGTTTAWDCNLGTSMDDENDFGNCYTTTLTSGEPVPTSGAYTKVGTCEVFARSKMMFVTAGFDEYFKVMPAETTKAENWGSFLTSKLSSVGCPSSAFPTVPPTTESKPTSAATTKGQTAPESTPTAEPTDSKSEASVLSRGSIFWTFMLVWPLILQIYSTGMGQLVLRYLEL